MDHRVAKYFQRERTKATNSSQPLSRTFFEQKIGLKTFIRRQMPLFLTLRDAEGNGLATAMLPPGGHDDLGFEIIIVGKRNSETPIRNMKAQFKPWARILASLSNEGAAFPIAGRSAWCRKKSHSDARMFQVTGVNIHRIIRRSTAFGALT